MASSPSRICIFLRHGESQSNVNHIISTDVDRYALTEKGRADAENAGRELAALPRIDRLYASPILRALQTAEIVSKEIKLEKEITPLLMERGFGRYNDHMFKSKAELTRINEEQILNQYRDWESWKSMEERITKFSGLIKEGEIVVAVSHMDTIKSALGLALGKNESGMVDIYLEQGSFTIIDFGKKGAEAVLAVDILAIPKEVVKKLG